MEELKRAIAAEVGRYNDVSPPDVATDILATPEMKALRRLAGNEVRRLERRYGVDTAHRILADNKIPHSVIDWVLP